MDISKLLDKKKHARQLFEEGSRCMLSAKSIGRSSMEKNAEMWAKGFRMIVKAAQYGDDDALVFYAQYIDSLENDLDCYITGEESVPYNCSDETKNRKDLREKKRTASERWVVEAINGSAKAKQEIVNVFNCFEVLEPCSKEVKYKNTEDEIRKKRSLFKALYKFTYDDLREWWEEFLPESIEKHYELAKLYSSGLLVNTRELTEKSKNLFDEYREYCLLKARNGNSISQLELYHMYHDGIGVEQNCEIAQYWLFASLGTGNSDAFDEFELHYADGNTIEKEKESYLQNIGYLMRCKSSKKLRVEANIIYKRAAVYGNKIAQYQLGIKYLEGKYVERDIEKAIRWLETSSEQGYYQAKFTLAKIYYHGKLCNRDINKSIQLFEQCSKCEQFLDRDSYEAKAYLDFCSEKRHIRHGVTIELDDDLGDVGISIINRVREELQEEFDSEDPENSIEVSEVKIRELENEISRYVLENDTSKKKIDQQQAQIDILKEILSNQSSQSEDKLSFILDELRQLKDMGHSMASDIIEGNKDIKHILNAIEQFENNQSILQNTLETRTNELLKNTWNKSDVCVECENELKGIFGDKWNKLKEHSRRSLISAKAMLKLSSLSELPDYSGICILASSALEGELKKTFFADYRKYVDSCITSDDDYPSSLRFTKHFTIGSLRFLFGIPTEYTQEDCDRKANAEWMKKYLNNMGTEYGNFINKKCIALTGLHGNVRINCAKDRAKKYQLDECKYCDSCFVGKCERIRCEFRNASAHPGENLSMDDAINCCNMIIGREKAINQIEHIQGLLVKLMLLISE